MKRRRGSILVTALVGTMIFAILSVGALSATLSIHSRTQKYKSETQAYYTAHSALEFFAGQISDNTAEGREILSAALANGSARIRDISLPHTMGECGIDIACASQSFTVNTVEQVLWEMTMTATATLEGATATASAVLRNYSGDYVIGSEEGTTGIVVPSMPDGAVSGAWSYEWKLVAGKNGVLKPTLVTAVSVEDGPYYVATSNQKLGIVFPKQSTDDMVYIFVRDGISVHIEDVIAVEGIFGSHIFATKPAVTIVVEEGGRLIFNSNSGGWDDTVYAYIYMCSEDQITGNSSITINGGLCVGNEIYSGAIRTGPLKGINVINKFGDISWAEGLPAGVTIGKPSITLYG